MAAKPRRRRRKESDELKPGIYLGETFGFGERPRLVVHSVDGPLAIYERGHGKRVALVSVLLHDLHVGGYTRQVRK